MATARIYVIGDEKSNASKQKLNLYLRFTYAKGKHFNRATGLSIRKEDWSFPKSWIKTGDSRRKKSAKDLQMLTNFVLDQYELSYKTGEEISSSWLKKQIYLCFNRSPSDQQIDLRLLANYFDNFIERLPRRLKRDGSPLDTKTINKYILVRQKLADFELRISKQVRLVDVGVEFSQEFTDFLIKAQGLSRNTIGRYNTIIKTICRDARDNGFGVNSTLDKITSFKQPAKFVFLDQDEINRIEKTTIEVEHLSNARDWLVISCYLGQRVSDLLGMNRSQIIRSNDAEMINLLQKKTGKRVSIPLHPKVKSILSKRGGDFPRAISTQKYNSYIKLVAKKAGISSLEEGMIYDEKSGRRERGEYEKWRLVSSHIGRRSFATNYYGEVPTPWLIAVTGHSTEKQFLEYIGKPPQDYAFELYKFWNDDNR